MMPRILDPHIHLWDLATGLYPHIATPGRDFSGDSTSIARSYLLPEFLAEPGTGQHLIGAVHVEAFPTDPLGEVAHLQAMADGAPIPLTVVGNADLTRDDIGGLLDAMTALPAFRGVRKVVNRHPDPLYNYVAQDYLADPAFARGFRALAARGLSFDLQLYPHQTAQALALIDHAPDVPVVLNHAGMWADRHPAGWAQWKAGLHALAARPQVMVKLSGMGMLDPQFTDESLRPIVYEVLEAFGAGRAMFASNFPVDKRYGSYADLWACFDRLTAALSADERAALFAGNAARFYRMAA